jgi:hypothetical protein
MATSTTFPFLDLPLELRLQTYGYIANEVPRRAEIIDFSGFYLSCRQIKQEFEGEYIKIFTLDIARIADSLPPTDFHLHPVSAGFPATHNLVLEIKDPVRRRNREYWRMLHTAGASQFPTQKPSLPATLDRLFELRLESLEIRLEDWLGPDAAVPRSVSDSSWYGWFEQILCAASLSRGHIRAKRVGIVANLHRDVSSHWARKAKTIPSLEGHWDLESSNSDGEHIVCWWRRVEDCVEMRQESDSDLEMQ